MPRHEQFNQSFVNAFDELKERNRKLFSVLEIDQFLSFENKKNVCLIINSSDSKTTSFLNSIIVNACINYHTKDNDKSKRTIMIDAENGNNLSGIYLELVRKSMSIGFDINEILNQITIVRAFTFYQLLNIIINELPKLLLRFDNCKIQIIALDLLNTLIFPEFKSKGNNEDGKSKADFKYNEKLVEELLDNLIAISKDHFVITWYDNSSYVMDNFSLPSKFDNVIEINLQSSTNESYIGDKLKRSKRESHYNKELQIRVKSERTSFNYTNRLIH